MKNYLDASEKNVGKVNVYEIHAGGGGDLIYDFLIRKSKIELLDTDAKFKEFVDNGDEYGAVKYLAEKYIIPFEEVERLAKLGMLCVVDDNDGEVIEYRFEVGCTVNEYEEHGSITHELNIEFGDDNTRAFNRADYGTVKPRPAS